MKTKEYSLFTAITMIVGTVIGSGIFFKSDNILVYTNGDIVKGILVFTLAAVGIVFGSLTISVLAAKTKNPGGLITYADEFSGHKTACAFGWFQVFVYYPSLIAVVAGVAGVYMSMLYGFESTPETVLAISLGFIVFFFGMNILSGKLGGYFQNAATVIKLIPLFLIAVSGFIFGDVNTAFNEAPKAASSFGWLAALAPIAFSYDGWVVSTSIAHEIKNSKRNLPIALVVGPIFVLAVYILYFVGICVLVGPQEILTLGDAHVNVAAQKIFGDIGAKIILVFIVVSVLGTVNGFVLGFIRLPYSLAIRNMFPASDSFGIINSSTGTPVKSGTIAFFICIAWAFVHYSVTKLNLMPNSDVSEIPIVASYILYIILYVQVIKMYFKKEDSLSAAKGLIIPTLAVIGSLIIIIGGLANPMTLVYIMICVIVIAVSLVFYKKENSRV
ncbi:APC family permease [Lachnospiraceae bacterium NSJ-143]|nr:APC family permease [Lachnospiraceae bacterium NSJ-143]